MSILLDVLLVAVLIVIVILAARKGIIGSIAGVLAFVIAIVLAVYTAKPVAQAMYKGFVYKSVQKALFKELPNDTKGLTTVQKAQFAYDNLPDFAKNQLEKMDITVPSFITQLNKTNLGTGDLYETLEDKIIRPIATEVLKHILYFALAVVYGVILRLIFGKIADGMRSSDTIEKSDMIIGGVIGVVQGLAVVFLICNLLVYIQPRIEKPELKQAVSDSAIVSLCEKFDPMEAISMAQAYLDE